MVSFNRYVSLTIRVLEAINGIAINELSGIEEDLLYDLGKWIYNQHRKTLKRILKQSKISEMMSFWSFKKNYFRNFYRKQRANFYNPAQHIPLHFVPPFQEMSFPEKSWTQSPLFTFHFVNPFRCSGKEHFISK